MQKSEDSDFPTITRPESEIAPPHVRNWRSLVFQGYLIAALVFFAILAVFAHTTAYFSIDLAITRWLQSYHSVWFDILMRVVSWPGYNPQVIGVVAFIVALLWTMNLRKEAAVSALTGITSLVTNNLIKLAVARPRPSSNLVEVFKSLTGFSFPSGHVMFYTSFFGFLFYLSYTLLKPSWKRRLLLLIFGALILLVGPSRIYLGDHWTSDVIGAYLLGSLILAGAITVYRRWSVKNAS